MSSGKQEKLCNRIPWIHILCIVEFLPGLFLCWKIKPFPLASSQSENIQGIVNQTSFVFPRKGFHSALLRLEGKFLHNVLERTQIKLNRRQYTGGVRKPDLNADKTYIWTYHILLWVNQSLKSFSEQQELDRRNGFFEQNCHDDAQCWRFH